MCFQEIADMQGDIFPDFDKEISIDSFVKQYEEQAKLACKQKGWPEESWKVLAEVWAHVDMDIFQDFALAGIYPKNFLNRK